MNHSILSRILRGVAVTAWLLASLAPAEARPSLQIFEGLVEYVEGSLARGSDVEARTVVESLEANPPTQALREDLIEPLAQVMRKHGRTDLADRLTKLRLPARRPRTERARDLRFPEDHGAHPLALTEWWYFTGQLFAGEDHYGYELTLFKTGVGLNVVHSAITDLKTGEHPLERTHYFTPSCRQTRGRLDNRFGEHEVRMEDSGRIHLEFKVGERSVDLELEPRRDPMKINGNAIIDMPEGGSSWYYSVTRSATKGTIEKADGTKIEVSGTSWFDHQWGTFIVLFGPWDWFSFQMDDGTDYNLFHFREDFPIKVPDSINRLSADERFFSSTKMTLQRKDWWKSPRTGDYFVTRWILELPDTKEKFEVTTPLADQEMPRTSWKDFPPAYWEGVIEIKRLEADGRVTRGLGYCEHMPYSRPWATRRDKNLLKLQ